MAISKGTASVASDLAGLSEELALLYVKAQDLSRRYVSRDIGADVNALPNNSDTVPETDFDKASFLNTMFAVEQFVKFMDGDTIISNPYIQSFDKAAALA